VRLRLAVPGSPRHFEHGSELMVARYGAAQGFRLPNFNTPCAAGPYPARRVPPLERRNFTLSRVGSFRNERVSTLVWLVGSEAVRSAREEPPGRPLVAVEQKRAFCSRTIARPCSMRQGERGELGKCARREVHGVAATFGIVDSEYGNGA